MRLPTISTAESAIAEHKNDRQFVTALARGFEILRCFNENQKKLTISEIASITGMPQPTVWRLCYTLVKCGMLSPEADSERLRVGLPMLGIGQAALAATGFKALLHDEMNRLALKYHLALSLAVRDQMDMIIALRARGDGALLINLQVGSRLPIATSTFGVAYLALVPQKERQALMKTFAKQYGKKWPAMEKHIKELLQDFESKGFIGSYRALYPDINSVAVPVHCPETGQILVLNGGGPANTVPESILENELAPELIKLTQTLQTMLTASHANENPIAFG